MAVTSFDRRITENPMLHANFTALSSTEPELLPTEVFYIAGIGNFALFSYCHFDLDPMTFMQQLSRSDFAVSQRSDPYPRLKRSPQTKKR